MSEDPDYSKSRVSPNDKRVRSLERKAEAQVIFRTREVLQREFRRALEEKERELELIDERILEVRSSLQLVRYGAVAQFYEPLLPKRSRSDPSTTAIHPALRPHLSGKAPLLKKENEKEEIPQITQITPAYIPPKPKASKEEPSSSKEPRGSQFKSKRRFVVGNVSKWIRCDERGQDNSTHKWMIYLRGDKENPDISDIVQKVRFLIHVSYHPHDVIEVSNPPFHLTRRGWGEFPARIQIHFKHPEDKPVDIIHNLKLDRTYTGLQTLGSETHVDIWCRNPDVLKAVEEKKEEMHQDLGGCVVSHSEDKNLRSKPLEEEKDEKEEVSTPKAPQSLLLNNRNAEKKTYVRCTNKFGRVYYLPVNLVPGKQVEAVSATPDPPPNMNKPRSSSIKDQSSPGSKLVLLQDGQVKVVKNSPDKRCSLSGVRPGTSLLRKNNALQAPFPAPPCPHMNGGNLTDLEKAVPGVSLATWKCVLGRFGNETQSEIESRIAKKGIHLLKKQTEFLSFLNEKILKQSFKNFPSWERIACYMAKSLPLITRVASDPLYRSLHPYAAASKSEYQSWNFGKRMASEWLRAKTIYRIIRRGIELGNIESNMGANVTTRRIWRHLRLSNYSVPDKTLRGSPSNSIMEESSESIKRKETSFTTYENEFRNQKIDLGPDCPRLMPLPGYNEPEEIDVIGIAASEAKEPSSKKIKSASEASSRLSSALPTNFIKAPPEPASLVFPEDKSALFKHVGRCASSIGINLVNEELNEGIRYPMARKLIFNACRSLCELILRESCKVAHERSAHPLSVSPGDLEVTVDDVRESILREPSLKILSNAGLGSSSSTNSFDYHSE